MNPCALAVFSILACGPGKVRHEPSRIDSVILLERFSSGAPQGFSFDRVGTWSVRSGRLVAVLPSEKQKHSFAYFGSEDWTDYAVDVDVCAIRGVDKGVVVRVRAQEGVGVDLRGPGYDDVVMYRGIEELGKAPAPNRNGRWHHLRVEVEGGRYRVYVNGRLKIDYLDEHNERPSGRVALAAYTGGIGQCEVLYDNVVVRSLGGPRASRDP